MWETYIRNTFQLDFFTHEMVYGPEEDTAFLLEYLSQMQDDDFNGMCMEVGCGLGLAAIYMARRSNRPVVVSDINPQALIVASNIAKLNGASLCTMLADGVSCLKQESLKLVVFNPPYLPCEEKFVKFEDLALCGGPTGIETALKFLPGIKYALAPEGKAIVLLSSLGDLERFETEARRLDFTISRTEGRPVGDFERLYIYTLVHAVGESPGG